MNKNFSMELMPEEVFQSMKKNSYSNYLHFTSYFNINQKYLSIRTSLFSLIHKISNKMNFKSNTYFLSIYFLDLIFLKNKIPSIYNDNYELLALTCLVLAAKHLENDPCVPHLQYFINSYNYISKKIMNNCQSKNIYIFETISFNDLINSEVFVCKMLNYKLNYFTIYDFNSFFFGHGILKIEQLQDIVDDSNSLLNINKFEEDDDLNYINPEFVKKILEKIYKKSRNYLDNVIKNKVCLKYDSFLISIYIMYKSVEYVIIKENKLVNASKNIEKYYLEKREDILRRKTSKCYKEIMNDIYKIDLDYLEEYQILINDDNFLKIFNPFKSNTNRSIQNNNQDKFDIREEKVNIDHKKRQSSNINSEENLNKGDKFETIETKFTTKKLSHIKVPSAKYNKLKRLKILEGMNRNTNSSKNKNLKSFIINSKENNPYNKVNTSINISNKNDILSKSNYNIDNNDIQYYNNNNNNYNEKHIESYKIEKKTIKKFNNDSPCVKNDKDNLLNDQVLFKFPTLKVEKQKRIYNITLDNCQKNKMNFKESDNNNNLILNQLNLRDSQITSLKPYSRKVIPKIEKKNNKNQKINKINNTNNKYQKKNIFINKNINKKITYNENNIKNLTAKNYELRSSNVNKYKNSLLDKILNDSAIQQKDRNTNYGRININMINQTNQKKISYSNQYNKIRPLRLVQNNNTISSMSINKIKVNGASNKNKLNKKIIIGLNKTPMKNGHYLRNALKRNIGVKRDNNMSSFNKINSLANSFEEENINKEKKNKNYSYLDLSLNKINNIDSNKKLVNIRNENIKDNNLTNSTNKLINNKNDRNNEMSSSNDEEDDDDDNNVKINNIRIDQYEGDDDRFREISGKNSINLEHIQRYNIKNNFDKSKKNKNERNQKIEYIQINKRKSPTIVINNNFNVNFDNKTISSTRPFSKYKNFNIK